MTRPNQPRRTLTHPNQVRENIAFGLVATNEEIAEAAKGAMLWDDVQAMSDGFETWVGFNGARSMVEWPS